MKTKLKEFLERLILVFKVLAVLSIVAILIYLITLIPFIDKIGKGICLVGVLFIAVVILIYITCLFIWLITGKNKLPKWLYK
jgi:hypothetical protein